MYVSRRWIACISGNGHSETVWKDEIWQLARNMLDRQILEADKEHNGHFRNTKEHCCRISENLVILHGIPTCLLTDIGPQCFQNCLQPGL